MRQLRGMRTDAGSASNARGEENQMLYWMHGQTAPRPWIVALVVQGVEPLRFGPGKSQETQNKRKIK